MWLASVRPIYVLIDFFLEKNLMMIEWCCKSFKSPNAMGFILQPKYFENTIRYVSFRDVHKNEIGIPAVVRFAENIKPYLLFFEICLSFECSHRKAIGNIFRSTFRWNQLCQQKKWIENEKCERVCHSRNMQSSTISDARSVNTYHIYGVIERNR